MKRIAYSLFLITCVNFSSINSQSHDSSYIVKEIEEMGAEINKMYRNSVLQNQKSDKISEEINVYYKNQLEELSKLKTLLEKHFDEYGNINQTLVEIDEVSKNSTKKIKNFEIRNYIVQFVLFSLLIFLIIFVVRFRRQSLDYLLSKANNLANQNDIIIEKADELTTIKETLNSLITEQRKKEKAEKKAARKKKKKK